MSEAEPNPTYRYILTQTKTVYVEATSAAEARKTAETLLQLKPNHRDIATAVKIEKVSGKHG